MRGNGTTLRLVANMNAQYHPGAPHANGKDDRRHRLQYFRSCLHGIAAYIRTAPTRPRSIAFPWRIGCGLALGRWQAYANAILEWAEGACRYDGKPLKVVIYQLPMPPYTLV